MRKADYKKRPDDVLKSNDFFDIQYNESLFSKYGGILKGTHPLLSSNLCGRTLWICYSGVCRSPTAAKMFGGISAGYYKYGHKTGRDYNTDIDNYLKVCDVIFVFESWMFDKILDRIDYLKLEDKQVFDLDIPDDFFRDQKELQDILVQKMEYFQNKKKGI